MADVDYNDQKQTFDKVLAALEEQSEECRLRILGATAILLKVDVQLFYRLPMFAFVARLHADAPERTEPR